MYGDIWDKEKYLNWMYENLVAIRSVMSDNASIYVHLDWHIGHYVKVLMDEIFGEEQFQNEIIWKRSTSHNDSTGFGNLHDTILYYSSPKGSPFHTQYTQYDKNYINTYYRHKDSDGRVYLDRDLSAKGLKGSGYTYKWHGISGYWRCPKKRMEQYERENRLYYTKSGVPRYKQYLDEMPGVPAQDIWTDIYAVNSQAEERIDYVTQKPEALLERIIKASSDEGMTVADFFGGSGVTAAVAHRLGRHFIHADVGINSIQTARDRLAKEKANFAVLDVQDGLRLFRNPVQTMDKIASIIPGFTSNDQLNAAFWKGAVTDSRYGLIPIYLPDLQNDTDRVLTRDKANRIIREALPDLPHMVALLVYIRAHKKSRILARACSFDYHRSLAEPLLPFIPLRRHGWRWRGQVRQQSVDYALLLYHTFVSAVSALALFPCAVADGLAWALSPLAIGPVSCIPQMEPLTRWAVIFICAMPRRERCTAIDACRPADAPVGISVVCVLPSVLFDRALEPPAAALAVFLPDCFF